MPDRDGGSQFQQLSEQFNSEFNKSEFDKEPPDFQNFCNSVAQEAKKGTESSLARLYLTADHKILEAVGRSGEAIENLEPTQIPFYRLDWDIAPRYESIYDGFTAWATLHLKQGEVGTLRWEDLKRHPAHKGQWDPVVWMGQPERQLHSIMFAPLWATPEEKENGCCRCFGLLMVELSQDDAPIGSSKHANPFVPAQESALKDLATWLCTTLTRMPPERARVFWRWFAERSAAQNAQHLMAVMRNWRSAQYNITEGLGYTLEFFRMLAGSEHALLVLRHYPWSEASDSHMEPDRVYVMPYWRPCWEERVFHPTGSLARIERNSIPRPAFCSAAHEDWDNRNRLGFIRLSEESATSLSRLLMERGGVGAVRNADLNMRVSLDCEDEQIKLEVEDLRQSPTAKDKYIDIKRAWLVDLRAGHSDFGTIILPIAESGGGHPGGVQPRSSANGESNDPPGMKGKLASNAVSLSRVLDRILGSGAGLRVGACLPAERPAGSRNLVIGFADIRNFSTVTRILRLMGPDKLAAIELFMEHFCRVMAGIANDWGRLDKFVGDGIVVLFGEDLLPVTPSGSSEADSDALEKSVLNAVCFAISALKAFEQITTVWLNDELSRESLPWRFPGEIPKPLLRNIRAEQCEDINLDLGIALNLGTVYMDYFGDTHGRAYSVIGDNVNLCARICDEAAKYDNDLGCQRAPILITQPVFEHLKNYLNDKARLRAPLRLQPRGLGLDYPIWEIWPKDLEYGEVKSAYNMTRYKKLLEDTLQSSSSDWSLKKEFIERLALKEQGGLEKARAALQAERRSTKNKKGSENQQEKRREERNSN